MAVIRALFSRMKGIHHDFALALLLVAVETSFEIFIPFLMAGIIDQGILNHDPSVFLNRGFWMVLCALGSLITGILYSRYASKACSSMAAMLREEQFEKIMGFSFENIDQFESSGLITRMTSDVMVLQNTLANGIRSIARGPSMMILGLVMAFMISPKLSMVFFIAAPVIAGVLVWIVCKVAPQYRVIQKTVDTLNGMVEENLMAIRLVKSFVREDYEQEKFDEISHDLAKLYTKTNHYAFLNLPAFQASMYLSIITLLIMGTGMIQARTMQVGQLTGILSYVLQIMNSFIMMSNVFLMLTRSAASITRIEEVLETEPTMKSVKGPAPEDGSIVFKNVSFRYSDTAEEPVLEHVDLKVPSGSRLGIVGGTGSAKTSLVQLIDRLYDISSGSLKVGGTEVRDLDPDALHDAVGMVLQKNVLFSGTVEENLKWGNPNATKEEIDAACQAACVDEFIDRLPGGLQMELGQGGVNVSGGQKQRLCIARALLKKPKILILDDSTSAVDTKTDAKIRQALSEMKDMTQIIIAQRIASVAHCDQIAVMDNGKIVCTGTHEELLEKSPIYREIYESQKGGTQDE